MTTKNKEIVNQLEFEVKRQLALAKHPTPEMHDAHERMAKLFEEAIKIIKHYDVITSQTNASRKGQSAGVHIPRVYTF